MNAEREEREVESLSQSSGIATADFIAMEFILWLIFVTFMVKS